MAGRIALIIALYVAALACFLLEMLTPTFGVLAVIGVVALGGSIWAAFTLSGTLGAAMIALSILIVPAYLVLMVKVLPRSPLGKRLFLGETEDRTGTGTPESSQQEALVGKTGKAETDLRPAGAVRVDGRRYVATAESGMIEQGAAVKVIRNVGMNMVVRPVKE